MNFLNFKKLYYQIDHFLYRKRNFYSYGNKIKRSLDKNNLSKKNLSAEERKKISMYFEQYGIQSINTDWHLFYSSLNNIKSVEYIPESIFYTKIEPALNREIMFPALEDKNLTELLFPSSNQPISIIKNINKNYYNGDERVSRAQAVAICAQHDSFVIKPSFGTYGGDGVALITKFDLSAKDFKRKVKKVFKDYKSDFIVQERIKQHSELASLNPTSINTIRIISYLRKKDVVMLSCILRIGRKDEFTDNGLAGGIGCGIKEDGTLKGSGYDRYGKKHLNTDNGTVLKNFRIPFFKEVKAHVKAYHERVPFFRLISWDITIDDQDNIVLIEFNSRGQGINRQQLNNGPLLGEYADEILKVASKYDPLETKLRFGK